MSKKLFINPKSEPKDDSFRYETINGNDNIVKVVSFDEGKKKEVYVYVLSEEEFDSLIPQSEKQELENEEHVLELELEDVHAD